MEQTFIKNRCLLLFLLLPIFLIGQEQVSQIEHLSLSGVTPLNRSVGFALIDNQQYMIIDKDSLSIYRLENGKFEFFKALHGLPAKYFFGEIDHNRSRFDIIDGKYFRLSSAGIAIVDIASGVIDKNVDYRDIDSAIHGVTEVKDNRIYLHSYKDSIQQHFIWDTETWGLESILRRSYSELAQVGDYIAEFDEDGHINFLDGRYPDQVYSHILESGLYTHMISKEDSTIVFIENDGSISKVIEGNRIVKLDCVIEDLDNLDGIAIKSDKLITVGNKVEVLFTNRPQFEYEVVVKSLSTCSKDFSFMTGHINEYATNVHFIENETPDRDFSIFGFSGAHPTDGLNGGFSYIIDHQSDKFAEIADVSHIANRTPFKKGNNIYCVGVSSSYWGGSSNLIKYSLSDSKIEQLFPQDGNIWLVLGYDTDGLYLAANESIQRFGGSNPEENPTIWKYDESKFEEVSTLDFRVNVGVNLISDVKSIGDRMYFTCNSGLYSTLEDTRKEISTSYNRTNLDLEFDMKMAVYKDEVATVEKSDIGSVFRVLNTATGVIDSFVTDDIISSLTGDLIVGPYIMYNSGGRVNYFDMRSKSFGVLEDLSYLSERNLVINEQTILFLSSPGSNSQIRNVYILDISTNTFSYTGIDLMNSASAIPGWDNSFYLIESSFDTSKITLLRKDGSQELLYEGPRGFSKYDFEYDPSDKSRTIVLISFNNIVLVSNNLTETEVLSFDWRDIVVSKSKNNYLIKGIENGGNETYHYYKPFEGIKEINTPPRSRREQFITDSLVVMFFQPIDSSSYIMTYDYENDIYNTVDIPCYSYSRRYALSGTKYLYSAQACDSDLGYELILFDLESGTHELLSDINPGSDSSSPEHFTTHKDWVYFTATVADGSRQWFRYRNSYFVSQNENPINTVADFTIFPSPALSVINFKVPLKDFKIYNSDGQLCLLGNPKNTNEIDVSQLSAGVYFIVGYDKDNEIRNGKFVKAEN